MDTPVLSASSAPPSKAFETQKARRRERSGLKDMDRVMPGETPS